MTRWTIGNIGVDRVAELEGVDRRAKRTPLAG
jgi:hypothetical protein